MLVHSYSNRIQEVEAYETFPQKKSKREGRRRRTRPNGVWKMDER